MTYPITLLGSPHIQDAGIIFGQSIIALHDIHGFPYVISFEMAKERGLDVSILGCLLEAAARRWSMQAAKQVVKELHQIYPQANAVTAWAKEDAYSIPG